MLIITTCVNHLSNTDKELLFNMYVQTYTYVNADLWYTTPDILFSKYPRILSVKNKYTTAYIMYQKKKYHKISVICHNGTKEGKALLIDLLVNLLSKKEYIIEATGAVSWILRKKRIRMIKKKHEIEEILEIMPDDPYRQIKFNPSFNPNNKNTQRYTYISVSRLDNSIYQRQGTLFGMIGNKKKLQKSPW